MPNRILKESICTSDTIDGLKPAEEVFFYRLIVNCDDYGRMDGRLSVIRSRCYPLRVDKVKDQDIAVLLQAVVAAGLVRTYQVGTKHFLQLVTFQEHQQVRAKKSKYPDPPTDGSSGELLHADDIKRDLLQPDVPVIQSNPNESESESNPIPVVTPARRSEMFTEFWEAYPKKKGKAEAQDAWDKLKPSEELFAVIMSALATQRASPEWKKDGGKFIIYPVRWLKKKRWEDEEATVDGGDPNEIPTSSWPGSH